MIKLKSDSANKPDSEIMLYKSTVNMIDRFQATVHGLNTEGENSEFFSQQPQTKPGVTILFGVEPIITALRTSQSHVFVERVDRFICSIGRQCGD